MHNDGMRNFEEPAESVNIEKKTARLPVFRFQR